MPVYSVNRRRAIVLLVLSSILLLTLDLRGNPLIDRLRSAFARVIEPFETASEVVATPIKNAWHGATDYDDLQRENEYLRELVAQQRGDQLTARAVVYDWQELATLNGLQVNIDRVTARVVGGAPGNFEQTVEIDRGSDDEIRVGMAVVNAGGLVGKITKVYSDRSVVRLVTDADYTIECKVSAFEAVAGAETDADATDDAGGEAATDETTPSGFDRDDLSTTTTTTTPPTTTTAVAGTTDSGTPTTQPPGATTTSSTTTSPATTTTAIAVPIEREVGGCEGRGPDRLPAMRFVTENPVFGGQFGVGDVITTAGGSKSTAPAGLIIGEVINVVNRSGSAGPLLEIDLAADLDHLNLVQVLRYVPPLEVPG